MKISYNELQRTYFKGALPSPEAVADALTFHAWEIESIDTVGGDTVLDVKVLPDKSAWALSHRGIAKDISVILDIPLSFDPLREDVSLEPTAEDLSVSVVTPTCTRYTAALIRGVTVGPSPEWLVSFLASMGQRSINNVVDITNYVMFSLGQPLHAFDAVKLWNGTYPIMVRNAEEGERITSLTGEEYTLSPDDAVIADGILGVSIGIAGIKGGKHAEVDGNTTDIILESANFDAVRTRKTSQRLKLRTDASTRYENGVSRGLVSYGLQSAAEYIRELCGGEIIGYRDTNPTPTHRDPVLLSQSKLNSVLGLSLTMNDLEKIMTRFGYQYEIREDTISVTPPFERPDLVIAEDLIEEIGRIYGYEHVTSIPIEPVPLREVNKRFYYTEAMRDILIAEGFSEIFTSSFRDHDEVALKNALASDKGCLRSADGIGVNMQEALQKNAPMADLFGSEQVRLFEIGTVFGQKGEQSVLVCGVRSKSGFIPKKDTKVLDNAFQVLKKYLSEVHNDEWFMNQYNWCEQHEDVFVVNLDEVISRLPTPQSYTSFPRSAEVTYKPFSPYPYLTRDVAFWCPRETSASDAEGTVRTAAGPLAQRVDMFDRFEKEERVSYGFRLVFQSSEKTLDSTEADAFMHAVYDALREKGWEVR